MTPFIVLSPGRFVDPHGAEIAIQAFSNLFHNVTPKHQKRLKLVIIEETKESDITENLILCENLKDSTCIVNRENTIEVEKAYEDASVFLFPTKQHGFKIIPEALSFNLPVLTFENQELKDILDNSCSMLVRKEPKMNGMEEFLKYLEILYFDPEVRKILCKGAARKYENELNWGRSRRKEVEFT